MEQSELITPEYQALLRRDHQENPEWGRTGKHYADMVQWVCEDYLSVDVLDYGAGKGELAKALTFPVREYDPAIPGKDGMPDPADVVVSTDVLEHVEGECLGAVLTHLRLLTKRVGLHVISTRLASHILPDGRNAHLLVRQPVWWAGQFALHGFCVVSVSVQEGAKNGLLAIKVVPRGKGCST